MIESMTHVAVVARTEDRDPVLGWLYKERGFHVMPMQEEDEAWVKRFKLLPDQSQQFDAELNRLSSVLSLCTEYQAKKPGFLDAMLPLKVIGTRDEIAAAVRDVDMDALQGRATDIKSRIDAEQEKLSRLGQQYDAIDQFAFLGESLPKLQGLKHVDFLVVATQRQGGDAFLLDGRVRESVAAQLLTSDNMTNYYALVASGADREELSALVADHGLNVVQLPKVKRGAKEELADLRLAIKQSEEILAKHKREAAEFSSEWLHKASLLAGHYESEKNLAQQRSCMVASDNMFVSRGYVKTDALDGLRRKLEAAIPSSAVVPAAAPEGEDPPVSMKWNKWISPASLLVKMYGLPSYRGVDPTIFVATIFFLFVGICFGDAAYGLILIGLMAWLKKRYREQKHLQDFFQVFAYCGYVAVLVGILTGSFFGDLTSIIPGLEGLDRIRTSLALIDPIKDSQTALYIAIGIGLATQFYGMSLRIYRDLRRGDATGAFCDGFLWMAFFAFLILYCAIGSPVLLYLFLASMVGLILTQGRDQSGWGTRLLVGVISLYGIVGGYGASAFLGDIISFARLMALSLTSAALGSTFNMLAKLGGEIAVVGIVVAVVVVVLGHAMNFFIGILGAFVHSARLVMLEFFGRFYEDGGYAYKPYGFSSSMVDEKTE